MTAPNADLAANQDLEEELMSLVAEGADVNVQGAEGGRPLHWAAHHGHVDAVQVLVEGGAEVNASAANGATPLHVAALRGHVEVETPQCSPDVGPM